MSFSNRQGQSIIELVAAVTVIVLALTSIITLTLFNVIGQKVSEDALVAANLGREGIEVIRNFRDTGWLTGASLILTGAHRAIVKFNSAANSWTLDYNVSGINDPLARLYQKNNLYVHDAVGSVPTKFYRLITLDFICADGSLVVVGSCLANNPMIALRLNSKVSWQDKSGRVDVYELTDYLYEWK